MPCVFCEIVAGTAPAIRIGEDDEFLGILDIRPFTRGHALVIPRRTQRRPHRHPAGDTGRDGRRGEADRPAARASDWGRRAPTSRSTTASPRSSRCSIHSPSCGAPARRRQGRLRQACMLRRDPTGSHRSDPARGLGGAGMSGLAEKALGLFVRTHDAVYQGTNGWIGHRIPGAPNSLLLHTVGEKPACRVLFAVLRPRRRGLSGGGFERRRPRSPRGCTTSKPTRVQINIGRRRQSPRYRCSPGTPITRGCGDRQRQQRQSVRGLSGQDPQAHPGQSGSFLIAGSFPGGGAVVVIIIRRLAEHRRSSPA